MFLKACKLVYNALTPTENMYSPKFFFLGILRTLVLKILGGENLYKCCFATFKGESSFVPSKTRSSLLEYLELQLLHEVKLA